MIDKISVGFTMLALIIVSASYFLYDNYDNGAELQPVKRLDTPTKQASDKNITELEATIAEVILSNEEDGTLREKLLQFGTMIDRIPFSMQQLNEKEWEKILVTIKNSFPQLNTHELITVLRCYGRYRYSIESLNANTQQSLTKETIFAHRDKYFGRPWSHTLFAAEFSMYSEQDTPLAGRVAPSEHNICELNN